MESISPEPNSGCWLWVLQVGVRGHGRFFIGNTGYVASRWLYEQLHGPLSRWTFVCHHCDQPSCVNPGHLFAGTHTDNMEDMKAKRRQARGERTPTSKLTAAAVLAITRRAAAGEPYAAIAADFGIVPRTVGSVARRETWRHVAQELPARARSAPEGAEK